MSYQCVLGSLCTINSVTSSCSINIIIIIIIMENFPRLDEVSMEETPTNGEKIGLRKTLMIGEIVKTKNFLSLATLGRF